MKNAGWILLAAIFIFVPPYSGLCQTDIDVTVFCDDNYPPYSYEVAGEAEGIYVEILKNAFSLMEGYNIIIEPVPWKRGLRYLEKGYAFAIFPPYYRPKTRPYMWPYSEPILKEEVVVICRKETLEQIQADKWPEGYYGLKIGNNAGFELGGERFLSAVKDGKIILEEARGNRINILKLGLGRIDCYINDRLSILWELKEMKKIGLYDEGGKHSKLSEAAVISLENGYLGFSNTNNSEFYFKDDFVNKFNTIIVEMKESGEIEGILDKFTE
jgi:polar amino acid transport system substrate-binding protein